MKLVKRLKDYFGNPKQKVTTLLPELLKFRNELLETVNMQPLDGIVRFFNATSIWHDREEELGQIVVALQEVNYGQYEVIINQLTLLCQNVRNAGRDSYGWNRANKGESVTDDKVFLGNIFGLWTFPVSEWKKSKNEMKGTFAYPGMKHLNAYDVVSDQAWQFMRSHVQPMCDCIEWLNRELRSAQAA